MGGRVASMVADELHAAGAIAGLLCLGYPFHPPGKPEQLRTAHLAALATPTLICQGTRDPFGTRERWRATRCRPRSRCSGSRTATTTCSRARRVSGFSAADHLRDRGRGRRRLGGRLAADRR